MRCAQAVMGWKEQVGTSVLRARVPFSHFFTPSPFRCLRFCAGGYAGEHALAPAKRALAQRHHGGALAGWYPSPSAGGPGPQLPRLQVSFHLQSDKGSGCEFAHGRLMCLSGGCNTQFRCAWQLASCTAMAAKGAVVPALLPVDNSNQSPHAARRLGCRLTVDLEAALDNLPGIASMQLLQVRPAVAMTLASSPR